MMGGVWVIKKRGWKRWGGLETVVGLEDVEQFEHVVLYSSLTRISSKWDTSMSPSFWTST